MRKRTIPTAAAAAMAAVLLAACSGGGGGERSGGIPTTTLFPPIVTLPDGSPIREGEEACGALSSGRIGQALGQPVESGRGLKQSDDTLSSCSWTLRSDSEQFVAVILSSRERFGIEEFRRAASGPRDVPGVGDEALNAGATSVARVGDRAVTVIVSVGPEAERRETSIELLRTAVSSI